MSSTPPSGAPETPGSSAKTALVVTAGAVIGATAVAAGAPLLLPVLAGGSIIYYAFPAIGSIIGGWFGWKIGGTK